MKDSEKIDYETNNFLDKSLGFVLIPVLNSLPESLRENVRKSHKSAKTVMENKTTHVALEALYNKGEHGGKDGFLETFFKKIWFNTNNAKAVRNRLKAVKKEVSNISQDLINNKKDLFIFSIASGSARAVIESIANIYVPEDRKITISFLDKNPYAVEYSKEKVAQIHFDNNFKFNWHVDTANNFNKYCKNKPNIIEMVGLLDYFDDEKALKIFKNIYENLDNEGFFITANIDDNKERPFVTNFIDWNMVYRNIDELKELALKAGFEEKNIKVFYEPLKIHTILVAKK